MATLPTSIRYANYDTTKIFFLPTIAASATLAATRAEITAGTDLTPEVSDVSGWSLTGATIDAPDLLSEFVSKVPGRTSAEDSSLTFYASENSTDVRGVLAYKAIGFIVLMHGGDVPSTGKMDVFPVRVTNPGVPTISTGDELAKVTIGFAITREPKLGVAIPAAV